MNFVINNPLEKWQKIKAIISDWDGVFTDSKKGAEMSGSFSEADSMGLNLLRYEMYLRNGFIPPFAIITGAENPVAKQFAQREKLQGMYYKVLNKQTAFEHFCQKYNLQAHEVAFFFDDVNDLGVAKLCGMRFLIQRPSTPLFTKYVQEKGLCDYISTQEGGEHALREISENLWQLTGNYEKIMEDRGEFHPNYELYFKKRQEQTCNFFTFQDNKIIAL
jgi:3-deoxy-D-manno-octulosonate 8-phosphate phosphatase (KDO 8-P phosphatase)